MERGRSNVNRKTRFVAIKVQIAMLYCRVTGYVYEYPIFVSYKCKNCLWNTSGTDVEKKVNC